MTEAQAGGQKGRATVDHLIRLNDTIQIIRNNRKPAFVAFLDVSKAYDKAWLDAILYVMYKEGTELAMWKIIKELNSNLTARLKTKYGRTRQINIKDSIRQGGVLSVIQYALIMDEINKEITRQKAGPILINTNEHIGCLLWMDDVALVADNAEDLQNMLNITYDVANKYHIEFGMAKSKILKIGKGKENPNLYLGNDKLEYVQTYKYLGITMNNKGNLENHIKEIKKKTEAAYQTILAIMGNKCYNNVELQTAWKLVETCIQPIITYGGETWSLNKKEEKEINRIQENIIRRILMVPQSTPTESLYIETGLLDITTITTKNRLNMEKRLHKHPERLATKIMEIGTKGGWKDKTTKMKTTINPEMETITASDINKKYANKINTMAEGKTKTQFLLSNTAWKPGIRPNYMNKLTRMEASAIFKARTRMIDVKNNFRGKYNDTKCRKCDAETETQEHILEECPGIHKDNSTKVTRNDIFQDEHTALKATIGKITHIMKILDEQTK